MLSQLLEQAADDVRTRRAEAQAPVLRGYAEVRLVRGTAGLDAATPSPKPQPLASAEFTTPRVRSLKIAARVAETATRVRIALAACPEAKLVRGVARSLQPAGP